MTRKETIDIIRESSLWNVLSIRERVEAITYALEAAGEGIDRVEEMEDISDVIGEIYSG